VKASRSFPAEFRKLFNTRALRWFYVAVIALSLAACAAYLTLMLQPAMQTAQLATADLLQTLGEPVKIFSPLLGILVMAGDWNSRDISTVFLLKPKRRAVFFAKLACAILMEALLLVVVLGLALIAGWGACFATGLPLVNDQAALLSVGARLGVEGGFGLLAGAAIASALLNAIAAAVVAVLQPQVIETALGYLPNGLGSWLQQASVTDAALNGADPAKAATAAAFWIAIPLLIGFIRNQRRDVG
jgi:hypothetical protein